VGDRIWNRDEAPREKTRKKIVPVARDKELRTGHLEIARICKKHGIRLSAMESWDVIAVYDHRYERPAKWPVAAFVNEIGDGRLKRLRIQSIMPENAGR
jgi:hypothetical protein